MAHGATDVLLGRLQRVPAPAPCSFGGYHRVTSVVLPAETGLPTSVESEPPTRRQDGQETPSRSNPRREVADRPRRDEERKRVWDVPQIRDRSNALLPLERRSGTRSKGSAWGEERYNGTQFTSSRFMETLAQLGITHRRTAYHHPEGNSYIERLIKSWLPARWFLMLQPAPTGLRWSFPMRVLWVRLRGFLTWIPELAATTLGRYNFSGGPQTTGFLPPWLPTPTSANLLPPTARRGDVRRPHTDDNSNSTSQRSGFLASWRWHYLEEYNHDRPHRGVENRTLENS